MRSTWLLIATAALAVAADITGTWNASVESSLGTGTPVFTLKQDGEKLTGEYAGALGTAKLAGTVKGDDVQIDFQVDAGGESIAVRYQGKLDAAGKNMKGTVVFGGLGEGTFTAAKR
jgi:cytochrome c-type biogenesis protein CcmE